MNQQEMAGQPSGAKARGTVKGRRIRWGHICGCWFLAVLLYILATSKRAPPEEVQAMVEDTQMLMGVALLPAITRGFYRQFFSD